MCVGGGGGGGVIRLCTWYENVSRTGLLIYPWFDDSTKKQMHLFRIKILPNKKKIEMNIHVGYNYLIRMKTARKKEKLNNFDDTGV